MHPKAAPERPFNAHAAAEAELDIDLNDTSGFYQSIRDMLASSSSFKVHLTAGTVATLPICESIDISENTEITFSAPDGVTLLPYYSLENVMRHFLFHIEDGATLTLIFDQVILDGIQANGAKGGGINVTGRGTLKLIGADIQNCAASISGGGVNTNGHLVIENSQFRYNRAAAGGGAYAYGGATITNCQFIENEAAIGGGLLVTSESVITNSRFEKNEAIYNGGAIDSSTNQPLIISSSSFIGNRQTQEGGAGAAISARCVVLKGGNVFYSNQSDDSERGCTIYTSNDIEIDGGEGETIYLHSTDQYAVYSNQDAILKGKPAFLYIKGDRTAVYARAQTQNSIEGKVYGDSGNSSTFAAVGTPEAKMDSSGTTLHIFRLADMNLLVDILDENDMKIAIYDNGELLDVTVNQTGSTAAVDLSGLGRGSHEITVIQTLMGQYESNPSEPVSVVITGSGSGGGSSTSTYSVRFESNEGSSVSRQSVARNGKVTEPTAPTREGYEFTGWYIDAGLTSKYDFDKAVTSSFTLYAGWQEVGKAPDPEPDDDHPAYISGYPDGTFRPDGTLSRAEAATLLYNLIDAEASADSYVQDFSGVESGSWHYNAVMELARRGIISGYSDGTFKPDTTITRAEFVTMALRVADIPANAGEAGFSDVKAHWAAAEIAAAVSAGYVSGYPDGTFQPERTVSRAEAVTILNRILACDGIASGNTFTDVPATHWAYRDITGAATGHTH